MPEIPVSLVQCLRFRCANDCRGLSLPACLKFTRMNQVIVEHRLLDCHDLPSLSSLTMTRKDAQMTALSKRTV